jgi:hypothetical protein
MTYFLPKSITNSDLTEFRDFIFGIKRFKPVNAFAFGSAFHEVLLEPKAPHMLRLLWCKVCSGVFLSVLLPPLFSLLWLVFCFLVLLWFLGSCPSRAWWWFAWLAGVFSCFVPCWVVLWFWLVVLSRSGSSGLLTKNKKPSQIS